MLSSGRGTCFTAEIPTQSSIAINSRTKKGAVVLGEVVASGNTTYKVVGEEQMS